jgi:hypothetical protein
MVAPSRSRGRRLAVLVSVLTALLSVLALPGVAAAAPGDPTNPDGSTPQSLTDALEAAARGYYDAQAVVTASQQRQAQLQKNLDLANAQLAVLSGEISKVAAARYMGASVGLFNAVISGQSSKTDLLNGGAVEDYLLWHDDSYIHQYKTLQEQSQQQQQQINAELAIQTKQLAVLDQQKRDAEKALAQVGGMVSSGYGGPTVPAQPVARNPDGSFPYDPQNINDPTHPGGLITSRTYHMLTEAELAGFNRHVNCWRYDTFGEHPLGRACDFSVFPDPDFVSAVATGDAKDYGNRIAAWAVANAYALGVLYVIWFQQIWFPGEGWVTYNQYGDPATEHKNHVHISVY